jgi:hypothetical protein
MTSVSHQGSATGSGASLVGNHTRHVNPGSVSRELDVITADGIRSLTRTVRGEIVRRALRLRSVLQRPGWTATRGLLPAGVLASGHRRHIQVQTHAADLAQPARRDRLAGPTGTGNRGRRRLRNSMARLLVALTIRLDHGLQPPAVRASASDCGT